MNEQQRLDGFLLAYESIVKMYGVQLAAQIQTRQYGAMVQCEPVLTPAFVAEWQAQAAPVVVSDNGHTEDE